MSRAGLLVHERRAYPLQGYRDACNGPSNRRHQDAGVVMTQRQIWRIL